MKVKLLKKIRRQYPISFVVIADYSSMPILRDIYKELGTFYYSVNEDNKFDFLVDKNLNGLKDQILQRVREKWTVKIKGSTEKIIRL